MHLMDSERSARSPTLPPSMSENPESNPINIGFVGLSAKGWAATTLAPPLFAPPLSSKYTLVAVSTTSPESAEASAAKYSQLTASEKGVKAYHGSAESIARDKDVGMVAVAVKPMYQKDAAMKVIESGKDLFVELPVGRNMGETKEICEAARKKGIKTMVGCQMRFAGFATKVCMLIFHFN